MLRANHQIEEITAFDEYFVSSHDAFDSVLWSEKVAPKLQYNVYGNEFCQLRRDTSLSEVAALLGRALSTGIVSKNRDLIYQLLSMNCNVIS